jgi:hypothetical protein
MPHMRIVRRVFTLVVLLAATTSCGDAVRNGSSSMYLNVVSLKGLAKSATGTPTDTLLSDVQTLVTSPAPCSPAAPCLTVFNDFGAVTLSLTPKNVLLPTTAITSNNQVQITRYHVTFTRADGLNRPGVDVPYGFDGAVTATVPPGGSVSIIFELVPHVKKEEPPLVQLVPISLGPVQINGVIINTIATVTFYGTDQVGNSMSAAGSISVEFGNFGD